MTNAENLIPEPTSPPPKNPHQHKWVFIKEMNKPVQGTQGREYVTERDYFCEGCLAERSTQSEVKRK